LKNQFEKHFQDKLYYSFSPITEKSIPKCTDAGISKAFSIYSLSLIVPWGDWPVTRLKGVFV